MILLVTSTCGALLFATVALVAARVHWTGRQVRSLHPRDAIVVLGARVLPDGGPSEALAARVEQAVVLHRAGLGRLLVFSGAGAGPEAEAIVAKRLAISAGTPEDACVVEPDSESTFDNAERTRSLLAARQVRTVWLVTDDFHVLRALAHFRRLRVEVEAAPVRRALPPGRRLYWTVREALALVRRPWLLF